MAGLISIGAKIGYSATSGGTYADIPGLLEIPSIGGKPSKVDVTTLADATKKYIFGVKDLGDLAFKFLYDNEGVSSNYRVLKGIEDAKTLGYFKVELPDETSFAFAAYVSTELDATQVDKAINFTASLALQSEITVVNPA